MIPPGVLGASERYQSFQSLVILVPPAPRRPNASLDCAGRGDRNGLRPCAHGGRAQGREGARRADTVLRDCVAALANEPCT
jgi:hypothetical protein